MAFKIGPLLQSELNRNNPLLQELRARRKRRQEEPKPEGPGVAVKTPKRPLKSHVRP